MQVQIDTKQKSHFLILLQIVTVVKELNVGTLVSLKRGNIRGWGKVAVRIENSYNSYNSYNS